MNQGDSISTSSVTNIYDYELEGSVQRAINQIDKRFSTTNSNYRILNSESSFVLMLHLLRMIPINASLNNFALLCKFECPKFAAFFK